MHNEQQTHSKNSIAWVNGLISLQSTECAQSFRKQIKHYGNFARLHYPPTALNVFFNILTHQKTLECQQQWSITLNYAYI